MKSSLPALLVCSLLPLAASGASAASVAEGAGVVPAQVAIQLAKNVGAYFVSPSPDIAAIQGVLPFLRGVDMKDPVAQASVAPILQNIRTAAALSAAPSAAMSEADIAAQAQKAAVLDTLLRPYVPQELQAKVAAASAAYRERISETRRTEIEVKLLAVAQALGKTSEEGAPEGSEGAQVLALGPYRAGPAPLPARGSYANRNGFSGPVNGFDLQFKKWKAQMSFRHDTDPQTRSEYILGTIVPATFIPLVVAMIGAMTGHALSTLAAALALGGLSYYGLVKLTQSLRRRWSAANAAADAAEKQLGFPVNVDEIPVTPEEIHQARKLYEYGREHPETYLMD